MSFYTKNKTFFIRLPEDASLKASSTVTPSVLAAVGDVGGDADADAAGFLFFLVLPFPLMVKMNLRSHHQIIHQLAHFNGGPYEDELVQWQSNLNPYSNPP